MRRGALIDEIQRLERALIGDESGARSEAETRAAKLDAAIERLEAVALSLEKQLVAIDGIGEFSAADEVLFAEERKTLGARITRLRNKIEQLQVSRPMVEVSPTLGRPRGLALELRGHLAELVKQLRADPHVSRGDVRPFQLRLVELVRDRRRRLDEASERLHDARDYLLHCAQRLEGLADSARVMGDYKVSPPQGGPPSSSTAEEGVAIDTDTHRPEAGGGQGPRSEATAGERDASVVTFAGDVDDAHRVGESAVAVAVAKTPNVFLGDRAAVSTRVEMAHLALEDALDAVKLLAHDWPELAPIADRPDWDKLPFAALRAELSTARLPRSPSSAALVTHFDETKQLCEALALWVDELRAAVSSAPPPIS